MSRAESVPIQLPITTCFLFLEHRLEAIAIRLEAIAMEAIAIRLEAIASRWRPFVFLVNMYVVLFIKATMFGSSFLQLADCNQAFC